MWVCACCRRALARAQARADTPEARLVSLLAHTHTHTDTHTLHGPWWARREHGLDQWYIILVRQARSHSTFGGTIHGNNSHACSACCQTYLMSACTWSQHAVLDSPSVPSVEKLSEKNAQLDTISDSTRDASAREGQGAGFPAACSAGGAPTDLHSDSEGLQGSPSARMEDRTSSSPHAGEGLGAGHIAVGLGAAHAASGTETGVGVGPGVGMEGNQQREASVRAGSEAGTSTSAMNTSTHPRSMIRRLVSEISNENNMVSEPHRHLCTYAPHTNVSSLICLSLSLCLSVCVCVCVCVCTRRSRSWHP